MVKGTCDCDVMPCDVTETRRAIVREPTPALVLTPWILESPFLQTLLDGSQTQTRAR